MPRLRLSLGSWLLGLTGLTGLGCLSACPSPGAPLEAGRCRCVQDCPETQQCLLSGDTGAQQTLTLECLPMSDRAGHCGVPTQP